jgi:hypothetical protein
MGDRAGFATGAVGLACGTFSTGTEADLALVTLGSGTLSRSGKGRTVEEGITGDFGSGTTSPGDGLGAAKDSRPLADRLGG